jgi:hypothetical protein
MTTIDLGAGDHNLKTAKALRITCLPAPTS